MTKCWTEAGRTGVKVNVFLSAIFQSSLSLYHFLCLQTDIALAIISCNWRQVSQKFRFETMKVCLNVRWRVSKYKLYNKKKVLKDRNIYSEMVHSILMSFDRKKSSKVWVTFSMFFKIYG